MEQPSRGPPARSTFNDGRTRRNEHDGEINSFVEQNPRRPYPHEEFNPYVEQPSCDDDQYARGERGGAAHSSSHEQFSRGGGGGGGGEGGRSFSGSGSGHGYTNGSRGHDVRNGVGGW